MTMISKVQFILYYSVFIFFIIEISALMGTTILQNPIEPPTIPEMPSSIDYVLYLISNIAYFFEMMTVSSIYAFLGVVILTPYTIALIWAILELIRGV